jgi:hypothetical protein
MKIYTIFSTDIFQYDEADLKENLIANGIEESEITEQMLWDERYEMQEGDGKEFWENIRIADNVVENSGFLIEGILGRWNGRHSVWDTARTLYEAIGKCVGREDDWEVAETSYGKLIITTHNHDASSRYEIYRLKEAPSPYGDKPAQRNSLNIHLRKALGWI